MCGMNNKLLWKIYTIWFLRRIVPLMLVEIVFLVAILKLLAGTIFFGKVMENAALASNSSYWQFFKYILGTFFQTHIAVQLFTLLILGVGALLLRDLKRVVFNYLKTFRK